MAVTRIKNNQITDSTITYAKIAPGTLVGSLFNENLTLNSNISIIGNLSVTGTSSSVSSTNTYVNDPLVVFNNGYTGSLSGYDIGILVNRNLASLAGYSGGVNTAWVWSEADSAFLALVTTDTGGGITSLNNSGFANIKIGNITAINATLSGSLTAQSFTAATFNGNVVATNIYTTNFSTGNAMITGGTVSGISGSATTLYAQNFSSGNAQITGGFTTGLSEVQTTNFSTGNALITGGTARLTEIQVTNFSSGNVLITGGTVSGVSGGATTFVVTNFSSGNARISGGYADNFPIGANTASTGAFTTLSATGDLTIGGDSTFDGNLIPNLNNTFNIGSSAKRWKDLWLSGSTIYIGDATIKTDVNGNLVVLTGSGNQFSISNVAPGTADFVSNVVAPYFLGNLVGTSATVGTVTATTGVITNLSSTGFSATTGVITNFSSGNARVSGGYADNFPIGANTAAPGKFTSVTDTALTSGRVVLAGTGGLLTDDSDLTFSGTTLTVTDISSGGTIQATNLTATGFSATTGVITNFSTGNAQITGGSLSGITNLNVTTLNATNFATGNAQITGGKTVGLTEVQTTDFSTGNAMITGGTVSGISGSATTLVVTNFSTGNAVITGGYADNFPIGANTAAPGNFTTLAASGVVQITNSTNNNGTQYTSGALQVAGGVGIGGNLYVQGNLFVSNIISANTSILSVSEPLLYLTADNPSNYNYEIGFYSHFVDSAYQHTGIVRDHNDGIWKIFSNVAEPFGSTVNFNNAIWESVKAGELLLANASASSSTSTGALRVVGGAGIQGALYAGQIFAGAINNTPIGNSTPSTGRFSSIYTTDFSSGNAVITGGSVNGTPIGATSASTGKFTGLTDTALTSGRVVIVTTGGELTDDSGLTYNAGTDTLSATHVSATDVTTTGDVTVGSLTSGRVTFATTGGKLTDDSGFTFNSGTGTLAASIVSATTVNATTGGFSTVNTNNLNSTNGNVTTLYAQNFSTGNAQITGGTVRVTEVQTTNFSSGNILVTGGTVSGISGSATTLVVTNLSSGNAVITGGTLSGVSGSATTLAVTNFSTGNAWISGGNITATLTGNITAEYATITNLSTGNAVITGGTVSGVSGGAATFVVTNFSTANAQITGGTVRVTEVQTTNFSTGNALITGGSISGITNLDVTTLHATNFSTANAVITGGSLNGTPIGASSASSAVVTTLGVTSTAYFSDTTEATTSNIGSVVLAGGLAVNKQIMVGGNLVAVSTTDSTNTVTGSFIAKGGVGIAGNVFIGKGLTVNNGQVSGGDFKARGVNASTLIWARSNSTYDQVLIGGSATTSTLVAGATLQINSTDTILLPVGTNSQRPSSVGQSDVKGMFRYSDTLGAIEWYTGSSWQSASTTFTVIADEQFNGDGSQVNFTLSAASTTNGTIVSINGVLQIPTLAYSVGGVGSTTLTFTEAPAIGDVIDVRRLTTTQTVTGLSSSNGYMQVNVSDSEVSIYTGSGSTAVTTKWDTSGAQVSQIANVTIATSGVATTIDTFAKATYRTAKYIIQSTYGSSYQSEEMLVIHDGSTATVVTGTPARTGSSLGTPSATISGSNVLVQFNANNNGTIIRIKKDYLAI